MDDRLPPEDRAHLKLADMLQEMCATRGWKEFERILEQHEQVELGKILTRSKGLDDVIAGESAKGAMAAFRLARTLPTGIISVADEIRKKADMEGA